MPLAGVLPQLLRDPFAFCMRIAAEHEGLARLDVGPMRVFLVSHPDYVHHISVANAGNYTKGRIMQGIRVALGNGLFTSDGELWRRQRRLMQPTFHQRGIRPMVDIMREEARGALQRWRPDVQARRPVDLLRETIRLNIRIVLRALFGASVADREAVEMLQATDAVFRGMSRRVWTFFMPPGLPLPGQRAFRAAIEALEQRIYALIAERRRAGVEANDLLGALLSARDEDSGAAMSDQQLRDEIFTLFLAGYESTASGVTWAWYLLSQHPHVAEALHRELDARVPPDGPSAGDLPQLEYTRRVIDETFRLYPAFPMYFRTSVHADDVGPYRLPADASIILSPYATHRDPRYWPDAERFDPDRFLPERMTDALSRAYYPFGKGQRLCIGKQMALATAQVLVATIFRAFDLQLPARATVKPHFALTLQPRGGLPMLLVPRAS